MHIIPSAAVPVLKHNRSVRVCGDYKVTVNKSLRKEVHPLPTPDDLFAKLEGGVPLAKLDLSHAYQQVELDEESQEFLVLNTQQGLLRYKQLNFGAASAPAIFQWAIKSLLQGAPMKAVFLRHRQEASGVREHLAGSLDPVKDRHQWSDAVTEKGRYLLV